MRMKVYSILFLLSLLSCAQDILRRTCPAKCYTGHPKTLKVGACKAGKPVCDDEYNVIGCVGEITPSVEICDGVDNDCDGKVDESRYNSFIPITPTEEDRVCFRLGECAGTHPKCENGMWTCNYPDTVEQSPETRCDGLDNDCDGLIDENLFEQCSQWDGSMGPCSCYSGPIEAVYPPCRPGFLVCNLGKIECFGEVTPMPELCDGLDNDCDGFIDDTESTNSKEYDIVLSIDDSGSMCGTIAAVTAALSQYISQFAGSEKVKFSIVLLSSSTPNRVDMLVDFSDISLVLSMLQSMNCNGSPFEASYDAIHMTCNLPVNPLGLSWRLGATHMYFGFTDEPAQSYVIPIVNMADIINMCTSNKVYVYQWSLNRSDFEPICLATGGMHFDLVANSNKLFNDLNEIISKFCE